MASQPTISFEKPSVDDRFWFLPQGASTTEIVDLARHAGLTCLSGSAFGWSRLQIQQWLQDEYGAATAWTRMDRGHAPIDPTRGLDDAEVARLVERMRVRVLRMVDHARHLWRSPAFARDAVEAKLVVSVSDRSGARAYAPASYASMGLVHRVTSLFVADYLARPWAYDRVVSCESCGEVSIGAHQDHPSSCRDPRRSSGIFDSEPAIRTGT